MDYNTFKTAYQQAYRTNQSDKIISVTHKAFCKMSQEKKKQYKKLLQERKQQINA